MRAYRSGNQRLLELRLQEANACVYNNNTSQIIAGKMSKHMAAFNTTVGDFVPLDEERTQMTGQQTFKAPKSDPIVVTAQCTKVMLDERILGTAGTISTSWENWTVPKITWVNGVPGCGKSTSIVAQFDTENDMVVTTTIEAASDLREKLAQRSITNTKQKCAPWLHS